MSAFESKDQEAIPQGPEFPSTHWSVVLAAGEGPATVAREALEKLCRIYWYPLYGFVRRQGRSPEDAQDLTQEFFARFLERESFKQADQDRGRFRTFMLSCLKHFLVSEWRKVNAAKRSGGPVFSLDNTEAEQRYQTEASDQLSPDKVFEKRWAAALLDQVLRRLGESYASQGKQQLFEQLKLTIWGNKDTAPYAELAPQLGMSEGALKVAVHRLRQAYLEMLRSEVAQTLANPADVDDELRHLIQVMSE
jgi:RNA polymerase sigma-70 factor (ECF subfamily)